MKVFVIYDKNGEIVSVLSPAEEFTDSISFTPPSGYSLAEIRPENLAHVTQDLNHLRYDSIKARKRHIIHHIHEHYAVDVHKQSIVRRKGVT